MSATITKRRKIESIRPPADIRDNTKTRRAWLAAKAAEVNAIPAREAKIVGVGSYQEVSVWAVETKAPLRIQLRGTCQGCGHVQACGEPGAVTRIAKHGYQVRYRGQGGFFTGTCGGSDRPVAEVSVDHTKHLIELCRTRADGIDRVLPKAIEDAKAAVRPAYYDGWGTNKFMEWKGGERVFKDTPEAQAVKAYVDVTTAPSRLENEARNLRAYANDLVRDVLPRLGQPLYEKAIL
jgi:hypothetical protein